MGPMFGAIDSHDHLFQQRAQELLTIAIGSGGRDPDFAQIGPESTDPGFLFRAECARTLLLQYSQWSLATSILVFRGSDIRLNIQAIAFLIVVIVLLLSFARLASLLHGRISSSLPLVPSDI